MNTSYSERFFKVPLVFTIGRLYCSIFVIRTKSYLGSDLCTENNDFGMALSIVLTMHFFHKFEVAFLGQIALAKNKIFRNSSARCDDQVPL
jgi:hypothetical protein